MWTRIPSSSLRITGTDRIDFVQGQMTGDLRGAPTPGMVACAFLNVRGQIEHFARAYKRPDDVYLHLDAGAAEALSARLRRYIIFDQVEIHDLSAELATVHLWHTEQLPAPLAKLLPTPHTNGSNGSNGPAAGAVQQTEWAGGTILAAQVNRTGQVGLDIHYLVQQEVSMLEALGQLGPERPLIDLDTARIAAGIPDIVRDGFVGTLPQEVGLDVKGPLPAISYRKGCYVGQEIMARLEARGNARYHLARLTGLSAEPPVPAGTPLLSEQEKVVGQSGLSAGGMALARIRKELEPGARIKLAGQEVQLQLLAERA